MSSLSHEKDLQFWTNLQVQSSLFSAASNFKVKLSRVLEVSTITQCYFPGSCQLGEHVRSARAGARLWLQANTGVTRELTPAGRLGDAGRFLDWNPRCTREFSYDWREGKGTRLIESRCSGPGALFRPSFQDLVATQMENSGAMKTGVRVTVGQRTRESLSRRPVSPMRAQEAADRDSLAALE